jgi:acyl-CoA synthetase (AMP-forming)/AMP-acid ligase II
MVVSTYAQMFRETVERAGHREALVFPEERLTYRALYANAQARASQLRALGVEPGDRFGLLMPNSPALVEFLVGGALLGATVVPINTRFRPHELSHVVRDGELRAIVTTDAIDDVIDLTAQLHASLSGLAEAADPANLRLDGLPFLRAVGLDGAREAAGLLRIGDLDATGPAGDGPAPEDPQLIMYTSGTTANPKGCVISNRGMVLNAHAVAERLEIPDDDRWWDPLPMFHMGGIMLMSAVFVAGGTFISQQHFDGTGALELIRAERPSVLYPLFPTIALDLIHHPSFDRSEFGHVRIVGSVAPRDVQQRLQDAFPSAILFSAYGITELCGTVAYNALGDPPEERLAGCGKPLPGFEMRIVDPETNEPLPWGERGELVGKGPQMFDGYYGNPEATAAVIDDEGFFHTGDACSMTADGLITYHGRIKDMLKVGGENVSAIEVESFLATHPAIKMAQVVGVPDDRLLEVVAAYIELVPGRELSAEEVVAFCEGRIARFKVPRHVRFVTEWPLSATKVQKFRLRDRLIAELEDPEPAVTTTWSQ